MICKKQSYLPTLAFPRPLRTVERLANSSTDCIGKTGTQDISECVCVVTIVVSAVVIYGRVNQALLSL